MHASERRALVTAIKQLPELQANLIILHYLYNHPLDQVAEILSIEPREASIQHLAALDFLRRWNDKFDGV